MKITIPFISDINSTKVKVFSGFGFSTHGGHWQKFLFIFVSLFLILFKLAQQSNGQCLPYPVIENSTLTKDCKPYKAIGVNYFDAFYRVLKNPKDKSYVDGFRKLSQNHIPFIRMMAGGFWPKDWELYRKNKDRYFQLLDEVVKTAEKYNIGLILTLFWNVATVPDLMGEPISAWGDPNSKTMQFMREYTREIVMRYRESPVIWGYEFGNEYNLIMDLPKGYQKVAPQYETPRQRTELDRLSLKDLKIALLEFAKRVRQYDERRLLSTGNSLPRPAQYNLAYRGSWDKDTYGQFVEILGEINPGIYNTVSIHVYPTVLGKYFADLAIETFDDLISHNQKAINRERQIMFIGEFGVCSTEQHVKGRDFEEEKRVFESLIKAIKSNKIPLSALWVYDRKKVDDPCNVTFENDRAYQLELIKEVNKIINFFTNDC